MYELIELINELKNVLEDAKNIPHTAETFSQRRDVLRKCDRIRKKMARWEEKLSGSVLDVLGADIGWKADEAVAEFYPTPESVEKTVEEFSDDMSDMAFGLDNIVKAAEQHGMSLSLMKRLETAQKLMLIATDFLDDTMDKY